MPVKQKLDTTSGSYRIKIVTGCADPEASVSYEQALDVLSRDDRFRAALYAMNTLLIHKGVYTQDEFQQLVVEWASKQLRNRPQELSHVTEASA
jgi:hypothetical protein